MRSFREELVTLFGCSEQNMKSPSAKMTTSSAQALTTNKLNHHNEGTAQTYVSGNKI